MTKGISVETHSSFGSPMNKHPILVCNTCQGWKRHHFTERRRATTAEGQKTETLHTNLMFECESCNTERVYGRE